MTTTPTTSRPISADSVDQLRRTISGLILLPADEGKLAIKPFRDFGAPIAGGVGPMPYLALQSMLDEAFPSGMHVYWRSHCLTGLDERAPDVLVEHFGRVTSPLSAILIEHLGGVYVNYLGGVEGADRVRAAYGDEKFARLVALKDRYDPTNLFCFNQNIPPSA